MPNSMDAPSRKFRAHSGLTLVEAAIAMVILSIVTVATSNVILTGVETQLSSRKMSVQQVIGQNIVDDIRIDVRYSSAITTPVAPVNNNTFGASSNQLVIQRDMPGGGPQQIITYNFNGGTLTRQDSLNNTTRNYNNLASGIPVTINCINNCFRIYRTSIGNQVNLGGIAIADVNATSVMDAQFGPANYTVMNVTFDRMTATNFQ